MNKKRALELFYFAEEIVIESKRDLEFCIKQSNVFHNEFRFYIYKVGYADYHSANIVLQFFGKLNREL